MMRRVFLAPAMIAALVMPPLGTARADDWLHFARNAERRSMTTGAPAQLSIQLWLAAENPPGSQIQFEWPSSPVVFDGRIFANARQIVEGAHQSNKIVAFDAASGQVVFETVVDKAVRDSWSSPAVDAAHRAVILGSGSKLFSVDADDGVLNWACPLILPVVNASPAVADDLAHGRAFITDYTGFGDGGALYCINTAAFDSALNPYQPGQIVWQEPIGGSSGNTPAYSAGVVYVASNTGDNTGCEGQGHIRAFDVAAPAGQRRMWSTCVQEGFFGGLCLADGFVYAASYDFFGAGDNSTLAKLRAADGVVEWSVPCERTQSIPIVDGDRIYLAAGLPGFGSAPKLQAFVDLGDSAMKLWDTYVDTGGALVVGGWSHQPVLADGRLCAGAIPLVGFFGAYTDLYVLDATLSPADPGFVMDHRVGMGSSPAICAGRVYTLGDAGLHALALRGDFSADGALDGRDLQGMATAVLESSPPASLIVLGDFDGDGELTVDDIQGLIDELLGH